MSVPRSNIEKMREFFSDSTAWSARRSDGGLPGRPIWPPLLAGAVLGLAFGLFIGWVLWPVHWTNASPTDLSPDAKADYLSSVADSYVAARNQQAADLAAFRLRHFGDPAQVAAEITAVQDWLASTGARDAGLRINNLNELASALQYDLAGALPVDGVDAVALPGAGGAAQADVDITPVTERPEPVDSGWGWARWLLVMATGLLLIAAGTLVLRRLWASADEGGSRDHTEDVGAFDEEVPPDDDFPGEDAAASVVYDREREAGGWATASIEQQPSEQMQESYAFEEESSDVTSAATMTVAVGDDLEASAWGTAFEDEEEGTSGGFVGTAVDDQTTTAPLTAEAAIEEDIPADRIVPDRSADRAPVPASEATMAMGDARARVKTLGKYRVRYDHGDPDYDESFNILDAESGAYIGECGMGVNMKSGILQNNPENVVALDVWLFDKTDERRLETQTVILVSQPMLQRDMSKVFGGERENVQLMQPEEGLRFELQGGYLALDCTIKQVEYLDTGIDDEAQGTVFRTLALDMAVLRRR